MTEADVRTVLARVAPATEWSKVATHDSLEAAGLDSLDKAAVILELERLLGTKIDDSVYKTLETIDDLAALSS